MTEFITRNYGNKEYEIIIKTDNKEHYKATEDFARRLIDHAKPKTNADRIRAMSDEELAEDYCKFLNAMLSKVVFKYKLDFEYDMEKGKSIMLKYLQQPAEGD